MPDSTFREIMAEKIGKLSGLMEGFNSTLENVVDDLKTVASKKDLDDLESKFENFKEAVLLEIKDLSVTAAREGAKNGVKWSVVVGIVTLIISVGSSILAYKVLFTGM